MGHKKTSADVLALTETGAWHDRQDLIVPNGSDMIDTSEAVGFDLINWETCPLFVKLPHGLLVPFGDKRALVRPPHFKTDPDDYNILTNRVVEQYQVVNNETLVRLANDLAKITGWEFEGLGTLDNNQISFIQLRLTSDLVIGGRVHEKHIALFFYGDDKKSGSGFCGLVFTRIVCWNTWRAALAEAGVLSIPHIGDPAKYWEFVNARIGAAHRIYQKEVAMLEAFINKPISESEFIEFVEGTFQMPPTPRAVLDGEQARALIREGNIGDVNYTDILERATAAQKAYETTCELIELRRERVARGFAEHNTKFPDSADTFYAAAQALTNHANRPGRGGYRGNKFANLVFGGRAQDDVARGFSILKELHGDLDDE